ncbi:prenyltransferase/squalene oxidase repeat-containing protein [Parachryseolinea silvisoli]|uniref:prenyltransferase/squalene oxidase repeat-containing protein n=1 Tax=Parachryseolinea silvisoli TaxID=2873601 RepID=UPI002265924C|nr:prenyltransferase/squalene oxidase repeat-containing protein [Parachryseolinea silvisoli]MCD9019438.1 hypothetical protein [Parachryseolinea silvisoli]
MLGLSKIGLKNSAGTIDRLKQSFNNYLDDHIQLPGGLKIFVFPPDFFDSEFYLLYPSLFRKVFGERSEAFADELCFSGFLYFQYLLCVDRLIDKDDENPQGADASMVHLKTHIYHEEALKILSRHFGKKPLFWELWDRRNKEFLGSILMDKHYNLDMEFDGYCKLAIGKCAFSKVAADAYQARKENPALHALLIQSIEYFSIARCIHDDLEDFKKDLVHRKNNICHMYLHKWMKEHQLRLEDHTPEMLEKYLFTSETAEAMLVLSKKYYQLAIDVLQDYHVHLQPYIGIIETLRNRINYFKVNIQAYRIHKYVDRVNSAYTLSSFGLEDSIRVAREYIANMQNADGSWFEVTNMQGMSNVWATGFIAAHLDNRSDNFIKAAGFLAQNKQDRNLWGYNTEWTFDYDSSTCALLALSQAGHSIDADLKEWLKGQTREGGFGTYSSEHYSLVSNLGLKGKNQVKGWIHAHVCVSALAYYFLSKLPNRQEYASELTALKEYLTKTRARNGAWQPYWWTSSIYPTSYIVQGMVSEQGELDPAILQSLDFLLKKQNSDGSFSCDVLKQKSVFYTALVLDACCASQELYNRYRKPVESMKNWMLQNQYTNGAFEGSTFLAIPNPDVVRWTTNNTSFKVNRQGGGNTVTGEFAHLFTTAVSQQALSRYSSLSAA